MLNNKKKCCGRANLKGHYIMIWAFILLLTTCPKPYSLVYFWQKADSAAEVRLSRGGDTQPPTPALMMSLLC